jgi:hypothetical protein
MGRMSDLDIVVKQTEEIFKQGSIGPISAIREMTASGMSEMDGWQKIDEWSEEMKNEGKVRKTNKVL